MRNPIHTALLILLASAIAWQAHQPLRAAPPNSSPMPPAQQEAIRLTQATGLTWRTAPRERAPGIGPELSAVATTWHGIAVPCVLLAFGSNPEGNAKLALYLQNNNSALDVVATDANRTLLAGPSREPDLTARILAALAMQETPESARARLRFAQAEWLDFRLGVARPSDNAALPTPLENGPTPAQIDDYARLLNEKGPNGGRHRGDPFLWYHKLPFCDLPDSMVTTGDSQKVPYVLLSDRPDQVLLNTSARPRPWHLKRVYTATDPLGHPAVALEFDDAAAKRMGALTESNIGRPLAVLFHGELMAVKKIDAKISDQLLITGTKIDQPLADRIVRSLSECMLPENEPVPAKPAF